MSILAPLSYPTSYGDEILEVSLAGDTLFHLKKGDKLIMHYHTVNHDESIFGEDAMEFDVRRAERMPELYKEHRAFGIGQHFCLGSHLARLELNIIMQEVIPRLRNPRLAGQVTYTRSALISGIKRMDISFDPEISTAAA